MWRYLAGGVAALLMAAAGMVLYGRHAGAGASLLPPQPSAQASPAGAAAAGDALPATVPEASDRTREQKRFDRSDKDRDGTVTRTEYLLSRRKAFAKLDINGDGQLSFDEWAAKTEAKFATADGDRSGGLSRPEFATTAVKRKAGPRRVPCATPTAAPARDGEDEG